MQELVRIRRKTMKAVEAARKMGVSKQHLFNVETGYSGDPSIKTVERYAKAIGVRLVVIPD
jgi:DNA-binding phage protein